MPSVLDQLKGGDRRSIGKADAVAARARNSRRTFDLLVDGLGDDDPLIRMRSADALEKASAFHPGWLSEHKPALLAAMRSPQPEVRWHIAQLAARVRWPPRQRARAIAWLIACLEDESLIVRNSALTALAEMAACDPTLKAKVRKLLTQAQASPVESTRARARRLLRQYPALESGKLKP